NQLSAIPAYGHDPAAIDRDYERSLISAYDRSDAGTDYYDRPDYAASWGRGKSLTGSGKLVRLDQLDDIDVAREDSDPRGWHVVGAGGEKLGKVHHLIGDVDAMKVRYLTVKIDGQIAGGDREVLIPVGHVALEPEDKQVRAPALDGSRLLALPAYEGGEITREHERALTSSFGEAYSDERRYHHPRYRYDRLYNRGATPQKAEASQTEPLIEGVIVVRRWRLEPGSDLAGEESLSEQKRRRAAGRRR
ncbi:MAG: PRC-barrel domain-containing protein, partial [Vicinamibacteria bacterium]